MNAVRELPCPYCAAPIPVGRARFFPSRRSVILCPTCGGLALLPLKAVLIGLTAMVGCMVPALLAIKPLFAPGMETPWDFLGAAAALLGVALLSTWIGTWACAQGVQALSPHRPPPRLQL